MLILARKRGQSLIINGDIEVKILEVKNGQVKVGISAPKKITVDRKEVHQGKQLTLMIQKVSEKDSTSQEEK